MNWFMMLDAISSVAIISRFDNKLYMRERCMWS